MVIKPIIAESADISENGSVLRTVGIIITLLSLGMGLLVLFVMPGNNYGSGLLLILLSGFFIAGFVIFLIGKISQHRASHKPS